MVSDSGRRSALCARHVILHCVIEQGIHDMEDSEGETAMGRLGNYSALDYRPMRRIRHAGIAVAACPAAAALSNVLSMPFQAE
jgi:hypothetical protein